MHSHRIRTRLLAPCADVHLAADTDGAPSHGARQKLKKPGLDFQFKGAHAGHNSKLYLCVFIPVHTSMYGALE